MMGMRILGVVMAVLLAGAAFAAAADFGGLDRDGNGSLDRAEIDSAAPELLRKYDLNGDGFIDRKEFKAAGGIRSRFDLLDRDKNGVLGLDEMKYAAALRFKEFDTNRDGRIDTSEWKKLLKKPVARPMIDLFYF